MHGASSALEDPLPCSTQALQGDTSGLPARPLDDLCSFPEANQGTGSGCGVQVRPVRPEACSEESRLNGLNSQAWCNPVIGQPEAKPYPSRIMRLFSNQKHCGDPASERTSNQGSGMNPQTWSGLSGLKVMGSFKKLRTSVFQGIQSRGNAMTANQDADYAMITNEDAEHVDVSNGQQRQQPLKEGCQVNGVCGGEFIFCSGASDDDEEEFGNDEGLQRNSHFSRSIRRAYGAGRITLLDVGRNPQSTNLPPKSPKTSAPCPSPFRRPRPVSTVLASSELHLAGETNGKALSQLSKSAENLHQSKAPFKRKTASAFLANPQQRDPEPGLDPLEPDTSERGRTPNIKRTTSALSVDGRERSSGRWRSPSRTRANMQRLVGSLTDLTFRRRPSSPQQSPQQCPLSPVSRLHDDYSRRIPCVPPPDRQRRPSPARPKAASEREGAGQRVTAVVTVEHTPSVTPAPFESQDLTELANTHKTTVEVHSLATQPANPCVAPLTSSPRSGARALGEAPAGNSGPVEDQRRGSNCVEQPSPQPVVDQRENGSQDQKVRHY